MRSITCTNNDGMTVTFSDNAFTPFLLASAEGIYTHDNTVNYTENTMIDGGTYQGTVASVRNIVLTLLDKPTNVFNQYNRDLLYALFEQGKKGTLTFNEDGATRYIDYYVESVHMINTGSRAITVSLICVDPFFYDTEPESVSMSSTVSAFEFEHDFVAEGEELSYLSSVSLQTIVNENAADNIGMTISIKALGTVVNPSVTKVETGENITVGSLSKPFTLTDGQVLIITTSTGDKHVRRKNANGTLTEVNEYLTEDSVFIQLMRGNNSIGYSADSGEEYMEVEIEYRFKYGGA